MKRKGVEKVFVKKSGLAETFCGCLWVITWPVFLKTVGIYIAICSYCSAGKVCTPLTHDLFFIFYFFGGWSGEVSHFHNTNVELLLSCAQHFFSLLCI